MTDLSEDERKAFRRAFSWPFDDLGPAGICTCDTYPLPIEDHGDECAVRALYEGWMAHREYSKQREEKLRDQTEDVRAQELRAGDRIAVRVDQVLDAGDRVRYVGVEVGEPLKGQMVTRVR